MTTEAIVCRHHWVIESPDPERGSRELKGRCRHCRRTRTFDAHADREDGLTMWGDSTRTPASTKRSGENGGAVIRKRYAIHRDDIKQTAPRGETPFVVPQQTGRREV